MRAMRQMTTQMRTMPLTERLKESHSPTAAERPVTTERRTAAVKRTIMWRTE